MGYPLPTYSTYEGWHYCQHDRMNQEDLDRFTEAWEPKGCETVRTIDTYDDTIERIVKMKDRYWLVRYFTVGGNDQIHVSVDLDNVDADHVIQHLAERL